MAAEEFVLPEIKDQVGWRLSEQDKQDLRLLMADRRQAVIVAVLREVIHKEAEATRRRWLKNAARIADLEEASG
jgi:sugar diacid utilization regulator